MKESQKYLHFKQVQIRIYKGRLLIALTNDIEKLNRKIGIDYDEDIFAFATTVKYKGERANLIALNFDDGFAPITHGVIAHEATHVANFIFEYIGVVPSFDNDEPLAYLTQWVVDEIYKVMNKYNKKAQ